MCSRTPFPRAASSRRRRCTRSRGRAASCSRRARGAGRTWRRGRRPCSRGAIRPARWTRRARCSTGSPRTSRPALRRSRGGLLGSLGYDLARALEPIPQIARDDLALPAIQLAAVDSLYAFDRERDELWILARAERELRRLREGLERVRPVARPAAPGDELRGMPYAHYRARVERVLDHIGRGDVYEVNYTQRLEGNCASALDLYARLRESAPVPYNLYLDAGGWQLVGATPETFLRVGADGRCETRPIKGTRPRDDDPAADAALAADLATHPKDRAENVMIVDLSRNDLSRVCLPGHRARAVAVRGRVAPDRPPARLDRHGAARPGPRRARPRGGRVRPRLDDRRAEGARDAADRAARAGPPRPVRRRVRLARPRRLPATWRS